MKTKILAVVLAVAMLVSMLPISAVVSANAYFSSDEFENLNMWEDMAANYRMSTGPTIGTASSVTTYDGKTVLKPAISQGRASGMTTIKAANFPTDKKVETITTKFRLPLENAKNASQTNPDSSPGVYLLRINNYNGLAFQVTNYYNKKDTADTNNGTLIYQWIDVYYSEGATQNNKVVDCTSKVSRKQTTTTADQWITATFTYDYSQIAENKLTVNAVLTPADGSTPITTSYTKEFEAEGNNAYSEGFQIGIVAAATANIGAYFDSYAVEFEKTAADTANEFKTKYADVLELEAINASEELETVVAAIAEYETLGDDVKTHLTEQIAKLNFLMNDFDATCFKEDYAEALALETVATNAQASAVIAAINAYAELDDAVKALLTEELAKLNALKATIKITEFDFEDEALFAETWESIPDADIWHTTGGVSSSELNKAAEIITETDGNSVLSPEYRDTTRKRRMLTLKDGYIKEGALASFSTDMRIDAGNNADRNPGIYYYFKDQYNWERIEFATATDSFTIRVAYASGNNADDAVSGLYSLSKADQAVGEVIKTGDWVNVKVDYTYAEEETIINITFTNKKTNENYTLSVESPRFNSSAKVGYGAGSNDNDVFYFDNFALTYASEEPEVPVVTPEELAAAFKAANQAAFDLTAIEDEAQLEVVNTTLAAYESLDEAVKAILADDVANLNTLKTAYETAKANKAAADQFVADYEDTIALEEIKNDDELGDVNAMLDAYAKLDEAVKEIVALDVSKFEGLKAVYIAAKEATEAAEAFNETYGGATTLTEITNDEELAAVEAMLAAYAQLDEAVQKLVNVDVAKYQAMVEAYETEKENKDAADKFLTDHKDALNVEKINSDEELEAVKAMLQAYEALSDAAKAFAGNVDVAKYEAMIAVYNTEKANKATAAEYEKTHAAALALKVIENDDELAAADAALADYAQLTDGVKAYLAEDIEARLAGMTGAYRAEKAAKADADAYLLANEAALTLETINSQAEYEAVVSAIAAYGELSTAAQAHLNDEIAKLNALKADYDEFLNADYTPVINGATIRRSGTQTLAFRCAVGAVNARKQVVDCGIIVTANSYLADGYVLDKDLTVDSTNDLVIVAPLEGATNITSGYEFTVNIGNITADKYGVRYVAKVYVKYSDGTVEYSDTETKSVISVAKAIAVWTFENYENIDDEYGVGDITEIIESVAQDGTITYAYDVASDNGAKILEYLETNNTAIATAYNMLGKTQ